MENLDKEIQNKVKETLVNYNKLIKLCLKNNIFFMIAWKNMNLSERVSFARALVYMESVAKNPKKYFSKSQTNGAWRRRVNRYVAETGVSIKIAYNSVPAPCDIVYEKCIDVLKRISYHLDYYDFLVSIQNYEYSNNVSRKSFNAQCIIDESERIKRLLINKQENKWLRAMRVMKGFDENKR